LSKSSPLKTSDRERIARFAAKQDLENAKAKRRKRDNRLAILVSSLAIFLAIGSQLTYSALVPEPEPTVPEVAPTQPAVPIPDVSIAENRVWTGSMEIGSAILDIELDGGLAPQAVASFLDLSSKGFFTGITCHRLTTEDIYVLQCGQSSATPDGGPGYTFGPIENPSLDNLYTKGTLAMARFAVNEQITPALAGSSMGSQFFIVYEDSTISSDEAGGYTVFGKITGGLEDLQSVIDAGVLDGGVEGTPALETQLGAIELR
jgi:peptidyl-prolyl cis-trans isomerase B (cyclophilin B)